MCETHCRDLISCTPVGGLPADATLSVYILVLADEVIGDVVLAEWLRRVT